MYGILLVLLQFTVVGEFCEESLESSREKRDFPNVQQYSHEQNLIFESAFREESIFVVLLPVF